MMSDAEVYKNEIGSRIRELRLKLGLKEQGFAEKIGCKQPTVNRYEKGLRMPDALAIKNIAEATGCDLKWLLTGCGRSGI